jgi:diguanylate cyclase (GGDEF)-like protein
MRSKPKHGEQPPCSALTDSQILRLHTGSSRSSPREAPVPSGRRRGPGPPSLSTEVERVRGELAAAHLQISELERSHDELQATIHRLALLASTDMLTGLGNRRQFTESLDSAFALAQRQAFPLSVVMLDVDHFKAYNDSYGHAAGDDILCILASRLLACSREYDMVTRYGGEEFAILLPATCQDEARLCAERQRRSIEIYPWPRRPVTASFGVATFRPETPSPSHLVEEADAALYFSKRQGRNCVHHHDQVIHVAAEPILASRC